MSSIATVDRPQPSVVAAMADRFGMRPEAFEQTLRATVVPSGATREELAAFLMVAKEYELNPITREIYAFPKRGGGIQPIVGVDGWANIINKHPAFDGMNFEDHVEKGTVVAITCRMWRKDRSHAVEATEYLVECHMGNQNWNKWPRRMLRHKAMVQAARYCFGFAGIVDPDEAERWAQVGALSTDKPKGRPNLAQALQAAARPPRQEPEDDGGPPRPPSHPFPGDEPPKDEDPEDDDDRDMALAAEMALEAAEQFGELPKSEMYDEDRTLRYAAGLAAANQGSRKFRFWKAKQMPEELAKLTPEDLKQLETIAKEADKQAPGEKE